MALRILASLALALVAVLPASSQDAVRLKNGKVLAGTIIIDPADKEGFKVVRWDTGATIHVKWSQIPEVERRRLLNIGTESAPVAATIGDMLDGVRIVTAGREVIGVVVKEAAQVVHVKTAASPSPIPVAVAAILSREAVKIQETDAYSPEEMLARRVQAAGASPDTAKLVELGRFAQAIKLFERAKELYLKAVGGDPTKDSAVAGLLDGLAAQVREDEAQKLIAAIRKLAEDTDYEKALVEADRLVATYADTETVKGAKTFLEDLKREAGEFAANRAKVLAAKVPDGWRVIRQSLWSEYASVKHPWSEAAGLISAMDAEIARRVATKFRCTSEEAETFWDKRERKPRTVSLGTGSWLVLGGQDGGSDILGTQPGGDPLEDFDQKFGQGGGRGGAPKPPVEKKDPVAKKVQTGEEWWTSVSSSTRREFVEAFYVLNSMRVERDEPVTKPCSGCRGLGQNKTTRNGQALEVLCLRCHGCKVDQSVTYR